MKIEITIHAARKNEVFSMGMVDPDNHLGATPEATIHTWLKSGELQVEEVDLSIPHRSTYVITGSPWEESQTSNQDKGDRS